MESVETMIGNLINNGDFTGINISTGSLSMQVMKVCILQYYSVLRLPLLSFWCKVMVREAIVALRLLQRPSNWVNVFMKFYKIVGTMKAVQSCMYATDVEHYWVNIGVQFLTTAPYAKEKAVGM